MPNPETARALSKLVGDLADDAIATQKFPAESAACHQMDLNSLRTCTVTQAAALRGEVNYSFNVTNPQGEKLSYDISATQKGDAYKDERGAECAVFHTESKLRSQNGQTLKPAPAAEIQLLTLCVLPDEPKK